MTPKQTWAHSQTHPQRQVTRPPRRVDAEMILRSTITCPNCGNTKIETMPSDACQFFYDCASCGVRLKPRWGDCCVFALMATCRVPRSKIVRRYFRPAAQDS